MVKIKVTSEMLDYMEMSAVIGQGQGLWKRTENGVGKLISTDKVGPTELGKGQNPLHQFLRSSSL